MLALFEHYSSILVAFFPENLFSENMKIRVIFPAKTYFREIEGKLEVQSAKTGEKSAVLS